MGQPGRGSVGLHGYLRVPTLHAIGHPGRAHASKGLVQLGLVLVHLGVVLVHLGLVLVHHLRLLLQQPLMHHQGLLQRQGLGLLDRGAHNLIQRAPSHLSSNTASHWILHILTLEGPT